MEKATLADFWGFVVERQRIWYRREVLGQPPPWTEDPVLRSRHFTNVFRAQDKGTVWFRGLIERAGAGGCKEILWRSVLYRLFNKIETFERFGFPACFADVPHWLDEVEETQRAGYAPCTRRHQVKPVAMIRDAMASNFGLLASTLSMAQNGADAMVVIRAIPTVGIFFGHQVFRDLAEAGVLSDGVSEYVLPGPGAVAGLRLFGDDIDGGTVEGKIRHIADGQLEWRPAPGDDGFTLPELGLGDVEHALCEFSRYWAVRGGARSPKTIPSDAQKWWAVPATGTELAKSKPAGPKTPRKKSEPQLELPKSQLDDYMAGGAKSQLDDYMAGEVRAFGPLPDSGRPTAIGIHIYAGAFTLGVGDHFDVMGQWEEGSWGAATFDLNFRGTPHPIGKSQWPVSACQGKVNLVYANPPCAPWSTAGARLGLSDPRFQFTRNVIDTALELRPDFFILESVCRAWTKGREFYESVAKRFRRDGWATTVLLTNAVLHGAPQNRERFHLIAHRYALDLQEPKVGLGDIITVGKAIGDLEESARWVGEEPEIPNHVVFEPDELSLVVLREIRPGEDWMAIAQLVEADGKTVRHEAPFTRRLAWDAPSFTTVKLAALVHPRANRMITMREGIRLCGYPDDFMFAPTGNRQYGARQEDVTQSVLPCMGRYLGGLCAAALGGTIARPDGLKVVDFRPLARQFGVAAMIKASGGALRRRL